MARNITLVSKVGLENFLSTYPLYSKIPFCELLDYEDVLQVEEFFSNKGYKYYCPYDKDYTTFKIPSIYGQHHVLRRGEIPEQLLDRDGVVTISIHLTAACQMCDFEMELLLNLYGTTTYNDDSPVILNIRKIGQLPAFERNPENDVLNYLNEEDKGNYKKALSNLSMGFGIGAFAYFRRIIENEIKTLVKDISELEYDGSDKIKEAYALYLVNHQMSNLIDSIAAFLPISLKQDGDNPVKILYNQSSIALHALTEEQCLEKAQDVDQLLRYVIKQVSLLKHEYKTVRLALKNLNK